MLEEHVVRHQPRHGHDLPAGRRPQLLVQGPKIRDARLVDAERVEAVEKGVRDAAFQNLMLAAGQRPPGLVVRFGVVFKALIDQPVARVVACFLGSVHGASPLLRE